MLSRNGQKALPLETPVDIVANRLKSYIVLNRFQNGKAKSIAAASMTGEYGLIYTMLPQIMVK